MSPRSLTQTHRAQQLLLRRATVAQMARLWPALDWTRLDASYPEFALRVAALVQKNRLTSAGLASQYLRAFRQASGIPGDVQIVLAEPLVVDQFSASLRVTSLVALKEAAKRGGAADVALKYAFTQASGAMARNVLDAGRDTITGTVTADTRADGWQRILGGHGCGFCQMLASRGAVYGEASADFASHDHCGCSAAPVYNGVELRAARDFVPTARNIPDADKARARRWIEDHPSSN